MGSMNATTLYEKLLKVEGDKLNIKLETNIFNGTYDKAPTIHISSMAGGIKQETLKNLIDLAESNGGNLSLANYGVIRITFKEGI